MAHGGVGVTRVQYAASGETGTSRYWSLAWKLIGREQNAMSGSVRKNTSAVSRDVRKIVSGLTKGVRKSVSGLTVGVRKSVSGRVMVGAGVSFG